MSANTLVIEGELLVLGPEPDLPGDTLSISVSKYRVLRVVAGDYAHPFIFVGHSFEDRMSPTFVAGVRHRLDLTLHFPPTASLLNPFVAETPQLSVYFCRSLTVLTVDEEVMPCDEGIS